MMFTKKHPLSITAFFFLFLNISIAQTPDTDNLDLNKMLTPIDSTNMFMLNDYYVWCNGAIKGEDGKYHLFYARWSHGKRTLDDDSLNRIFDAFW